MSSPDGSDASADQAAAELRSFPPPPPRPEAATETPPEPALGTGAVPADPRADGRQASPAADEDGLREAEAIARVAAIAASSSREQGPSKALVTTAVALAALVVALLLLAAVVSVGPDVGSTP